MRALSKRDWVIAAVVATILAVLAGLGACHGIASSGPAESDSALADGARSGSTDGSGSDAFDDATTNTGLATTSSGAGGGSGVSSGSAAGGSGASAGSAASGGSGASSGSAAGGSGASAGSAASGGSGVASGSGAKVCGGAAAVSCDQGEWCDYGGGCGAGDKEGQCQPAGTGDPTACSHSVCGCDGRLYCNTLAAHLNGTATASMFCIRGDGGADAPCMIDSDCQTGFKCCQIRLTFACVPGTICRPVP
jgi:hypothetical protein